MIRIQVYGLQNKMLAQQDMQKRKNPRLRIHLNVHVSTGGLAGNCILPPFIWIPSVNTTIRQNKDKLYCNDHFSVASIGYNKDREISSLVIVNVSNKDQVVYELKEKTVNSQKTYNTSLSGEQMQSLENELQRTGVGIDAVCDRYKIENPAEMPDDIYKRVMKALAKTKSKVA